MSADTTVLFVDETILRLFPPLRSKWAWRGEQARVRISGRNAKRVLFGAINPRTGRRVVMRGGGMRQELFQAFLRLLRRRWRGRPLALLPDDAHPPPTKTETEIRDASNAMMKFDMG